MHFPPIRVPKSVLIDFSCFLFLFSLDIPIRKKLVEKKIIVEEMRWPGGKKKKLNEEWISSLINRNKAEEICS